MSETKTKTEQAAEDPFEVLGLEPAATAEDIRAAYLQHVKQHPPDRDPDGFERSRAAYEKVQDPIRRVQQILLKAGPKEPLISILDAHSGRRQFTGPDPWLAVLKEE